MIERREKALAEARKQTKSEKKVRLAHPTAPLAGGKPETSDYEKLIRPHAAGVQFRPSHLADLKEYSETSETSIVDDN